MRHANIKGPNHMIIESVCRDTTHDQRMVIEGVFSAFNPLLEADISDPNDIVAMFASIERSSTASGQNRTMAGKAVDAKRKLDRMIDDAGKWLKDTTPVQKFDQRFNELKSKVAKRLGDDSKVLKTITRLGDYAKENPTKTAFVLGLLTVAATVAGSGMLAGAATFGGVAKTGGAVGYVLRMGLSLLKGEDLSTAIGKGIKTALTSYIVGLGVSEIGALFSNIKVDVSEIPGFHAITHVEEIATFNGRVVINLDSWMPSEMVPRFNRLMKAASDAMVDGKYDRAARAYQAARQIFDDPTWRKTMIAQLERNVELYDNAMAMAEKSKYLIHELQAAAEGLAAGVTSKDDPKKPEMTEGQIHLVHLQIEEAFGDTIRKAAGNVARKITQTGTNITTKVTADKLERAWRKAGSPTDVGVIAEILRSAGVNDELIRTSLSNTGVSDDDIDKNIGSTKTTPNPESTKEVPFKSGNVQFDTEAEAIFNRPTDQGGGQPGFIAYWKSKIGELKKDLSNQTSTDGKPKGPSPVGTVVSLTTGRFKKIDDQNRWMREKDGRIVPGKLYGLSETGSSGGTSSGSVASVAMPMGAVMRRSAPVSFFGATHAEDPLARLAKNSRKPRKKRQDHK